MFIMPFALFTAALALCADSKPAQDPGPLVQSPWLVHRYGKASAVDPANDQQVKGTLSKALGKDGKLSLSKLDGIMEAEVIKKLAGPSDQLSLEDIKKALEADTPPSRRELFPKIREQADFLTTSLDRIDEPHRLAGRQLLDWIAENYHAGQTLHVIVICTGNSRRSILGAAMGNIAAAYYGLPAIKFHSGGTAPTAFNARAVTALQEIGVEIEPTGREASRGEPGTANPVYRVRWGTGSFEAEEFSKRYDDLANPRQGFAALMVCGEADASCPLVKGAAVRISMPYLDPKIYDGGAYETFKYAERRDDMGRLMLSVLLQVRNHLASRGEQLERPRTNR
jgi:arsenate reductase (thioredoxin)